MRIDQRRNYERATLEYLVSLEESPFSRDVYSETVTYIAKTIAEEYLEKNKEEILEKLKVDVIAKKSIESISDVIGGAIKVKIPEIINALQSKEKKS